ncbi:hypothetical protein ACYJ1Y_16060 [Natrialbaceae archaeon A-gly3]
MEPRRRYKMISQEEVEQTVYRYAPAGTKEIADAIGLSRQTTAHRLHALELREKIWKKKVGPTNVWMHPRVMPDPDPDRDTSAEDVHARIHGDVYRVANDQPLGAWPNPRLPNIR